MFKYSLYAILIAGLCGLAFLPLPTQSSCAITGTLRDSATKAPIASATVRLLNAKAIMQTTTTDKYGNFSFSNIAAGKYSIQASYAGYKSANTGALVLQPGAKKIIEVFLSPSGKARIRPIAVQAEKSKEDAEGSAVYEMQAPMDSKAYALKRSYACTGVGNVATDYNTENYAHIKDNGFKDAKKNPLSTFSIDVDKASYSNVRRFITTGSLPPADAVRVEELINYFPYNYPQPKNEHPFSITTQYSECPWNKNHNLIHVAIQGKKIQTDRMRPNNLVFLIDVSGSMSDPNKLPLLKSGLGLLIDQMRSQDKIGIVVYAGAAGLVLPMTSGDHKESIRDAINRLEAGGSTAGGAGIALAYKVASENFLNEGNNRVVLCTDGDFNVGVSSDGELVRMIEKYRETGVFLTVLGFGTGNYKDSKMEQLADKGNGNYAYIDNMLEAKKVLVKEMGGTLVTIAKDVKIQVEFNPSKVKAYRLVGYENRLLNDEDFNDDKKDAGELGSGHNVTALYEIIPAGSDEPVASIDPLKYQAVTGEKVSGSNEVMTIKFRYKEPTGTQSKLITEILYDKKVPLNQAGEDFRFITAISEFGMLLRNSEYKGQSDFKSVLAIAKASKGADDDGYRAEFIRLVEMAEMMKK